MRGMRTEITMGVKVSEKEKEKNGERCNRLETVDREHRERSEMKKKDNDI